MENQIRLIEKVASKVGGEVTSEYSGRSMFGELCYGITCDDDLDVVEESARVGLPRPKIDNMGRQFICYWPRIKGKVSLIALLLLLCGCETNKFGDYDLMPICECPKHYNKGVK